MIILEKPYVSTELKVYLEQSQIPVLKTDFAIENAVGYKLNLVDDETFKKLYNKNSRLYTVSENALDWIYKNIDDETKINAIRTMKDKTNLRKALKSVYPDFFFMETDIKSLKDIDFNTLKKPFVIKPTVGFFSVGIYTIVDEKSWKDALKDIDNNFLEVKNKYPESVIGSNKFILEEYIQGTEYAIDAYYDDNGNAVILNILQHDFSSTQDVSDRLYYTSSKTIKEQLKPFTDFLNLTNKYFNAKNFPVHVEIRVDNGKIIPIEFNTMRFGGCCATDISYFAYGFKTYDYYFNNIKPDWNTLLKGKDDKIYSFIILPTPTDTKKSYNFDLISKKLAKVLNIRKNDGIFPAFIFVETNANNRAELDYMLKADLEEFLV